jgi:hypothetical protein
MAAPREHGLQLDDRPRSEDGGHGHEEHGGQHRPAQGGRPRRHQHGDPHQRLEEREAGGVHERGEGAQQAAGDGGQEGADAEHQHPGRRGIDPQALGGGGRVGQRPQDPAEAGHPHRLDGHHPEDDHHEDEVVEALVAAERDSEELRTGEADEARRAEGERGVVEEELGQDAEAEGGQGQEQPRQTDGGDGQQRPHGDED